jgi:hypothetical protein
MKRLCFFLAISLCLSCNDNYQQLRRDLTIQQHFNRNEAKDLASIVEFFDEKVCNCVDKIGIQGPVCYRSWFDTVKNSQPIQVYCPIDKSDQWAFSQRLYKSTIQGIWTIQSPSEDGKYAELPQLSYNPKGAYWQWLTVKSQDLAWIGKYMTAIEENGHVTPTAEEILSEQLDQLDLADPTHRLLLAVHVLTYNSNK